MTLERMSPAVRPGSDTKGIGRRFAYHVDSASAEPLLQRLDGVQKSGSGWRARCPACGGKSRKLSIAETPDKVMVHCFAGCKTEDVIGAVGLTFADLFPPRTWPQSPEERRRAQRAMRESSWAAALVVLALEANVVRIASRDITRWRILSEEDDARLAQAVERIDDAANVLIAARW